MENYLFGIDIGGTYIKAALFNEKGSPVNDSFVKKATHSDGSTKEIKASIQAVCSELKSKVAALGGSTAAVCCDIPGPFDFKNGVSFMKHKFVSIYGVELKPWFHEIVGDIPVSFVHDSASFLLGCGDTDKPCAGVMIGTGLGFALMADGKVLMKENGSPLISIYSSPFLGGIAEDFISAHGVVDAFERNGGKKGLNAKEIGTLADLGDPIAVKTYKDLGTYIGQVISPVLKEYGIESLYLGGQISRSFNIFGDNLKKETSDCTELKKITPVFGIDTVHMRGAVKYYLDGKDEKI